MENSTIHFARIPRQQQSIDRRDEPAGRAGQWLSAAGDFVGRHPHAAVVLSLTIGVFLGWLVKRK
jgi:ElaB/YqjD/DUF883 family membrane-anchored ribosome-binding protein